jgi:hypothetical protein
MARQDARDPGTVSSSTRPVNSFGAFNRKERVKRDMQPSSIRGLRCQSAAGAQQPGGAGTKDCFVRERACTSINISVQDTPVCIRFEALQAMMIKTLPFQNI